MEIVDLTEFFVRTVGGRPNQMDMSAYAEAEFECGCGETHAWTPEIPVLRELRGMRLVLGCPDSGVVNCVKVRGWTRFRGFRTLFATAERS